MLPAVMRWNKPVNAERQAMVAAAMGHPGEDAGDVLDAFIAVRVRTWTDALLFLRK